MLRRSSLALALVASVLVLAPGALAAPTFTPGEIGEAAIAPNVFRFPQAVAYDPTNGNIFVGDEYSGRVQAFSATGQFLWALGERAPRHEPGRLGVIGGVAVDRSGHLYVLDSENDRVQVFSTADGHYISTFGNGTVFRLSSGGARSITGIAAGGIAVYQPTPTTPPKIYVADNGHNRVLSFTISLASITPTGPPKQSDPSIALQQPQGLAVNPRGTRLFVADDRNHRVVVLARVSLRQLASFGTQGNGPGEFENPYDVSVDDNSPSSVFVADNLNGRVNVFDAKTLQFTSTFGGNGHRVGLMSIVRALASPTGPAGGVAVADTANDRIQVFNNQGDVTAAWGIAGRGAGYFTRPHAAAFAPDGGIVVADTLDDRIARFGADGSYVGEFGYVSAQTGYSAPGTKPGQYASPNGVAVSGGNIWVADTGNGRIAELDANGNVLYSSPLDGLSGPQSIAPGPDGGVYVADTGDGDILQFAADHSSSTVRSGINHPAAVAWDGHATVYAADSATVMDATAGKKVPPPPDETRWDHPSGLAVGPDGTLYVSERRTKVANGARVIAGTPDGNGGFTWSPIAGEGNGDGQVIDPMNLSLSPDGGTLLVADSGNNRILRFDTPGHAPPLVHVLNVSVNPPTRGVVISQPDGIDCATDCFQHYGVGRAVTLVATSIIGSTFTGWTGDCAASGTNRTCTVVMNADTNVGAGFVALPPPPVRITGLRVSPRHWHLTRPKRRHHHSQPATRARVAIRIAGPPKANVTLAVQVARPGKRVGGKCVAFHGKAPSRAKRCTRYATQRQTRTLHLIKGTTRFTITPRVVHRTLKPGTYRLLFVATDAAGHTYTRTSRQIVVRR
jgi:sugar lactone lactonase YvrE